jgi:hypothetical protein
MKKSTKKFLDMLPEDIREKAIAAHKKTGWFEDCESNDLISFIDNHIKWDESVEGDSYWSEIYDRANNGEFDKIKDLHTENFKMPYDFVNPDHYKNSSREVIDMMLDIWGKDDLIKYCEMCSFKYRMRLGLKPGQSIEQDLDKAKWYESKAKELRNG